LVGTLAPYLPIGFSSVAYFPQEVARWSLNFYTLLKRYHKSQKSPQTSY